MRASKLKARDYENRFLMSEKGEKRCIKDNKKHFNRYERTLLKRELEVEYLSQQQCEMIINSSVKVVEPPPNYDSNHHLTKEQRLKKAAEILDIDEYNAELDIINGDVKSFTDVQESIKWLRGEVE